MSACSSVSQKASGVFACTAWAEVGNSRIDAGMRAGGIGPDIGPMVFFAQSVDQRLQLRAAGADPLRQG